MSVTLPEWPGPASAEPSYLDFGTTMDGGPSGGGPRIHRLGNRFALAVSMPMIRLEPMEGWGVGARVFLSRLRQGQDQGVVYPWPQLGFDIGAPGNPILAAAAGPNVDQVKLAGLWPGYVLREGQFFNLQRADGRRMLHHTTDEVEVAQDGTATLPILPRTRATLAAGSAVSMEPVIEGRLTGDSQSWTLSPTRLTPIAFTVTEYGNNE